MNISNHNLDYERRFYPCDGCVPIFVIAPCNQAIIIDQKRN